MTSTPAPAPAAAPSRGVNTLLILMAIALIACLAVPLVPAGVFAKGVPVSLESFSFAPGAPGTTLFGTGESRGFLNFLYEGLTSGDRQSAAVGVIALILLIGGSFALVNESGAVDRGLLRLIAITGGHPGLLLGSLCVAFSLGGAVFGMGEETIAFLVLLLPLVDRLGLPRESAVMATYMSSQVGFATSWMNPFSLLVAQGVADVAPLSGAPFRIAMWALYTAVTVAFVVRYAYRHKVDVERGDLHAQIDASPLRPSDRIVLLAILALLVWIVFGITQRGYYLPELASQFFALGLFAAVVTWLCKRADANRLAEVFTDGVRGLVPVALIIGAAKGMLWLLGGSDPHLPSVLNTMLYGMGQVLERWPTMASAEGMLLFQSIFNFFVTSGSAQASITMPLMAGLGDIVGVNRQVAVLAFQLGDGLTNVVVPTSAVMMGATGIAGVGFTRWLRAIWRYELLMMAMAAGMVAIAVAIGFS